MVLLFLVVVLLMHGVHGCFGDGVVGAFSVIILFVVLLLLF